MNGVLRGIKGQYLIFDTGVINMRKYGGYHLVLRSMLRQHRSQGICETHSPRHLPEGLSTAVLPDRRDAPGLPAGGGACTGGGAPERCGATPAGSRRRAGAGRCRAGAAVEIDDELLEEGAYTVTDETAAPPRTPDQFELRCRPASHPQDNTSLEGLYKSRTMFRLAQCEAEGFRKITLPGSARVMACSRCGPKRNRALPGVAEQRQSGRAGRAGRPPLEESGTTRSPSPPTCLRWWPASWSS